MLGGSALNWTHDVLTERIEEKKRNEMDDKSRWKYRLISWNPRQIILSLSFSLSSQAIRLEDRNARTYGIEYRIRNVLPRSNRAKYPFHRYDVS